MKVYTVLQENITKYFRQVMLFSQILELGQSVNQGSYHPIKKDPTLCPIRLHPSKNVHYLVSVYLTMRLLNVFLFSQSNPSPLASLNHFPLMTFNLSMKYVYFLAIQLYSYSYDFIYEFNLFTFSNFTFLRCQSKCHTHQVIFYKELNLAEAFTLYFKKSVTLSQYTYWQNHQANTSFVFSEGVFRQV